MIIRCPHCAFARTVDEDRIPPSAQTATCPKCRHKFRFRGPAAAGEAQQDDGAGHAPTQATGQGGQPAPHHAGEHGEDIWDRVASLGESWADDDSESDAAPGAASYKQTAAWDNERAVAAAVPWEHIRDIGLLKAFGQTVWQAWLKPGRFFSALGAPRKLGLAVAFYLVVTALQTYMFQAWMQLFPESFSGFAGLSASALLHSSGLSTILTAPLVWLLFLAAVTGLSVLILRLISGRAAPVAAIMRVLAYSSAPMLLGVVPFIGVGLGQIWAMLLFALGCKHAFHLKFFTALVALLPVYLCLAVLRIVLSGSF